MSDTVNQQGTPSEAEVAWLGGIIEGEGTLSLSVYSRNEDPRKSRDFKITANVILFNTDAGIIVKACEILDRMNISYYIVEKEQKPMLKPGGDGFYTSKMPMLRILVKGMDSTLRLTGFLYPWLFGEKKHRCALIIKFLIGRLSKIEARNGYKRIPYEVDDLRIAADFYKVCPRAKMNPKLEGLLNELEQNAA